MERPWKVTLGDHMYEAMRKIFFHSLWLTVQTESPQQPFI